jgi:hypothetical protein
MKQALNSSSGLELLASSSGIAALGVASKINTPSNLFSPRHLLLLR